MRQCFPRHALDDASAQAVKAQVFQSFAPDADWSAFDRGVGRARCAGRAASPTRTRLPRDGVAALIDAIPDHLQPMPDSVALIERVRAAGHRLALLSNMPRPYAAHLEATHECFGWFEHRAWSGRLGLMKPAALHLRPRACRRSRSTSPTRSSSTTITAMSRLRWDTAGAP